MINIILPIYYNIEYKTKKDKRILVWMNAYRNMHHHLSNKIKHYYHDLVREQLLEKEFDKKDKINILYKLYLKNKRIDWPNVRSVIEKFLLDWIVECWVISNDTCDIVTWDRSEYYIDKENPRVEVTII